MNKFDSLYFSKYIGEDYDLLFVCHRHPVLIIDTIILWCFFGVVMPVFFYLQNSFGIADLLPTAYFELFLVTIYLITIYKVFDWYNDVWLITNRGIIDVDWQYMSGTVQYIEYENVHGIEIKSDSVFDSVLGKWDIMIRLAGQEDDFSLSDAVNPQGIVEYIQAVIDELHHDHEEIDDRKPFELLLDTLTEMVREHLEKGWVNRENEELNRAQIDKALRYASTVDLRDGHENEHGYESQE